MKKLSSNLLNIGAYVILTRVFFAQLTIPSSQSGKGLGSQLTKNIKFASNEKYSHVYVERHEENLVFTGMMRRTGFNLVETFYAPEKRATGSKNYFGAKHMHITSRLNRTKYCWLLIHSFH